MIVQKTRPHLRRRLIPPGPAWQPGTLARFWRLGLTEWRLCPPAWAGGPRLRVLALSDIHVGEPWMPLSRLERIVAEANRLEPDLVVLLGDYIAERHMVRRPVPSGAIAGALAGLAAPLGVHAILGNHDWWEEPDERRDDQGRPSMHRALSGVGIPVHENRAVRLGAGGGAFWLAGLGSMLALRHDPGPETGVDDLAGTLAQVADDAPVLLLAHEPDIFPEVPDRVGLTLAGHTHGGQVRLAGRALFVPSRYRGRYAYGHVHEGGRHMVVSGGLGCSVAPVRIGMDPELTLVTLG